MAVTPTKPSLLPQAVRIACVVALAACVSLLAAQNEDAKGRSFLVSYSALGPEVESERGAAAEFTASLSARPGLSAEAAGQRTQAWHSPPRGAPPERWVSLVTVGFRTRRDWLAFVFDGPSGSATLAVRRPARIVVGKGARRDWIPPGEWQISENAIKELAADFGHAVAEPRPADAKSVVSLTVKVWEGAVGGGGGDAFELDEGGAEDEGLGEMGGGAGGGARQEDLDGVSALAFAAACSAGWNPTAQQADRRLLVEVARGVNTYGLRTTLTDGARTLKCVKEAVPAEDLYLNLARMCLKLSAPEDVLDLHRLASGPLHVMAHADGRLVVLADGALVSYDAASGKAHWTIPGPERGAYHYATRKTSDGTPQVFRLDGGLRRVKEDGELEPVADVEPAGDWAFALMPAGDAAVVTSNSLRRCSAGKALWTFESERVLTCGPALAEDRLFAGNEAGELICLALEDGKELWRKQLGEPLDGPLACAAGLVIGASKSGTLIARRAKDGEEAWRADVGDVLLAPPEVVNGALLVAAKDNTLRLLDPATGGQKAAHALDTWCVDVSAAAGGVVCTDLRGTVTFLNAADLRPVRKLQLPARPGRGIVYAAAFPDRWGAAQGLIFEEKPVVLVSDKDGFLYLLSAPGRAQP